MQILFAMGSEVSEELLPRARRHVTEEKNRGRAEHRTYIATPASEGLRDRAAWRDLTSVGCVVSVAHREGKETIEVRYFIKQPEAECQAPGEGGPWSLGDRECSAWGPGRGVTGGPMPGAVR